MIINNIYIIFFLPSDTRPEMQLTRPKNRSAHLLGGSAARRWGKCRGETTNGPQPHCGEPTLSGASRWRPDPKFHDSWVSFGAIWDLHAPNRQQSPPGAGPAAPRDLLGGTG